MIKYVQQHSRTHRLEGGSKLRFAGALGQDETRFLAAEQLFEALQKKAPPPGKNDGKASVGKAAAKRR